MSFWSLYVVREIDGLNTYEFELSRHSSWLACAMSVESTRSWIIYLCKIIVEECLTWLFCGDLVLVLVTWRATWRPKLIKIRMLTAKQRWVSLKFFAIQRLISLVSRNRVSKVCDVYSLFPFPNLQKSNRPILKCWVGTSF